MPCKQVVKNSKKGSRQVYLNTIKFDPYRHKLEAQRLSVGVLNTMTSLCCRRCCDIIQWKVDYGKYVPLERSRRCNTCRAPAVTSAYHRICQACAEASARCAKCQKAPAAPGGAAAQRDQESRSQEDEDKDEDDEGEGEGDGEHEEKAKSMGKDDRYAFVDHDDSDEELRPLRGLDVRQIKARRAAERHRDECERVGRMRERERRTVMRRAVKSSDANDDDDDSDEEI